MSSRLRMIVLFTLAALTGATPAHAADSGGAGGPEKILMAMLTGPAVLLLCVAALAVVYLAAAALRKQMALLSLGHSAVERLTGSSAIFALWGLLAVILLFSAGLILSKMHPFGILAAIVWFSALAMVGMGACVAAVSAGQCFHAEVSGGEATPLEALSLGLRLFFTALIFPLAGWIVILLAVASGIGAFLTCMVQGEEGG